MNGPRDHRYTHRPPDIEISAIGGRYSIIKEARLPFAGREVLYLVGYGFFDTSCCGLGGCAYALVPGFVVEWRSEQSPDGLPVSIVEPIRDETVRQQVRRLIKERETVQEIRFGPG